MSRPLGAPPKKAVKAGPASAEHVARCWQAALDSWDVRIELGPPEPYVAYRNDADEPLAFIDLNTRRVVVNFELLDSLGASDSLTAVLAHEIGHHVRFPHTLGEAARLQVLEKQMLPFLRQSLLNLFFDLQVNEFVGRTRADDLCRVYAAFRDAPGAKTSPLFYYYLSIYEELWAKPPGTLVPASVTADMDERFPGHRADARMFVDTFYSLPGSHLQFVYFCSRFLRYLEDPAKDGFRYVLSHDMPEPDAGDYAGALYGDPLADAALDEAVRRGWLAQEEKDTVTGSRQDDKVLTVIDRVTNHMPGQQAARFRQALVSRHYRMLAARHLVRIRLEAPLAPEPSLPTVTEDWERGESLRSIDWTQSILQRGLLASAMPLQRELIVDDSPPDRRGIPGAEIYLDTSGSMPNPSLRINAMTLAAQIVALSALRQGGRVRGVIYSSNFEKSEWMYGEEAVSTFLLRYAGGGTDFPFGLLEQWANEDRDVLRVVISDSDFLYNCKQKPRHLPMLHEAASRSVLIVLLLAAGEAGARQTLAPVLGHPRVRLVTVQSVADLAAAAARLAQSLLEPVR